MSQNSAHHNHSSHSTSASVSHELKHAAAETHKAARAARKVDSTVYMAEVLASGNPKRVERYFLRKLAYRLFGKFMGKTINRI
ncbi:MAG TPA: hypothetical protein VLJ14_15970 [Ktedonobacterales bacterium]|nr:hypothetical protein [Ktedonobacterales bacterium]